MKNSKFYNVLAGFIASMLLTVSANAQLVNCNTFLQGAYVEVGVNFNGAFGSSEPAPAGYHPRGAACETNICGGGTTCGTNLGFVADPAKDGWAVGTPDYIGDYFLPGVPQEGWSIEVAGAESDAWNASSFSLGAITGSNTSYSSAGGIRTAVWDGAAYGLSIKQTTTLDSSKLFFTVSVVLTNTTTGTLTGIYYGRTVDPDNEEPESGDFTTINDVTYQLPNAQNAVLVSARGTVYGAYLGLGTLDCRAKCYFQNSSLTPTDQLDALYNGTATNANYSGTNTLDVAIGLVYSLGSLAPGQSTSLVYTYILNAEDLTAALNAASSVSGGSNVAICSGTSTTLTATGGTSYSWAPSTGLSCTSCATTTASPTATTTYTVTGISTAGCPNSATVTVSVNPCDAGCPPSHGEATVCICHKGHTIAVAPAAVPAHLAHGDYLGPCHAGKSSEPEAALTSVTAVTVYPNPNDGVFNVQIPVDVKKAEIMVTDLVGRVLVSRSVSDNNGEPIQISLINQVKGLYIIKVNTDDATSVSKVLVR